MKQKTAVEWVEEVYNQQGRILPAQFEQAKEEEKQQRENLLLDIDIELAKIEDYAHGEVGSAITKLRGKIQLLDTPVQEKQPLKKIFNEIKTKSAWIIDAIIFTRNNWTEIQEFTGGRAHNLMIEKRINGIATCIIQTSSGSEIANEGDYIVRRVNGEYYSCKPYLFKMIYEPINQQQTMNDVEQETLKRGEEIIAYCKEFGYQLALKSE